MGWDLPCAVCRRPSKGFAWAEPIRLRRVPKSGKLKPLPRTSQRVFHACSMAHMDLLYERKGNVTTQEMMRRAVIASGDPGGAYLEKIGKSDLATLSVEEWHNFLAAVNAGFTSAIDQLTLEETVQ